MNFINIFLRILFIPNIWLVCYQKYQIIDTAGVPRSKQKNQIDRYASSLAQARHFRENIQ